MAINDIKADIKTADLGALRALPPDDVAEALHDLDPAELAALFRRLGDEGLADLLAELGEGPDVVVLDPPRAGAGPAVSRRIAGTGARAVVYVACDPAALARDIAAFGASGYRLAAVRGFDAFPMTAHVECVALLLPA